MSENRKQKGFAGPQPRPPKTLAREESGDTGGGSYKEEIPDVTAIADDAGSKNPCAADEYEFEHQPAACPINPPQVNHPTDQIFLGPNEWSQSATSTSETHSTDTSLKADRLREALVRITGLPADTIKLVDSVLNGLELRVDLPIASAARLVALQQLEHPLLHGQGLAKIAVDQTSSATFARAVRYEVAKLNSPASSNDQRSPYNTTPGTARLRIILEEGADA